MIGYSKLINFATECGLIIQMQQIVSAILCIISFWLREHLVALLEIYLPSAMDPNELTFLPQLFNQEGQPDPEVWSPIKNSISLRWMSSMTFH